MSQQCAWSTVVTANCYLGYSFWYPVQRQSLMRVVQHVDSVNEDRQFLAQVPGVRQQLGELQLQVSVASTTWK